MPAWVTGAWGAQAWFGTAWATGSVPPVVIPIDTYAPDPHPKRRKHEERKPRDRIDEVERAWDRLTGATEAAEKVIAAPVAELPPFQPVENRLSEALAMAGQVMEGLARVETYERERLRDAMEAAREAKRQLIAREEAEAERRAEVERVRVRKVRRRKAYALIAMHLLDED